MLENGKKEESLICVLRSGLNKAREILFKGKEIMNLFNILIFKVKF